MKRIIVVAALAMSVSAQAEVYKCPGPNGKVLFQQLPCAGGQVVQIDAPKPSGGGGIRESERVVLQDLTAGRQQLEAQRAEARKEREAEQNRQEALAVERRKARAMEAQAWAIHSLRYR